MSNRAYVMEGGRVQYSGTAQELRDKPELLHSAYLLRGGTDGHAATPESLPAGG
jgi:branched-chain amino acid transport system ATP-binding protein